jgi:hypothetical protein
MNKYLIFTICILFSNITPADSFRCGRSLVKVGDSANTLIKKCGDPVRKYTSKENISDHGRQVRTGVSNWVFPRKGGKDMIVSVYSGAVVKMQID